MIYLNEHDAGAVEWCRELMRQGHLPQGRVDERDIQQVTAKDLDGCREAHFFGGIGGWPLALRLAGWDIDRHGAVWTGSCPCQPFSAAGKRKGEADERDLWTEFFRLIAECRPPVVFGEQVASADVVGASGGKPRSDAQRVWLDRIHADLEAAGYTFGACVLGAHSVGSPHIRQRLYWVGDTSGTGSQERVSDGGVQPETGFAHARQATELRGAWSDARFIGCRDGKRRRIPTQPTFQPLANGVSPGRMGLLRGAGNAIVPQVAAAFVKAFIEAKGGG